VEIDFITEKIKFTLKGKARVKNWVKEVIQKEKQIPGTICCIFCSDNYLLQVNKKYLDHDFYTDIITFDYTEKQGKKKVISGDLLISVDRVKENARGLDITFEEELRRVMIHGILHLLGYKDKTAAHQKEMRKKENLYLKNIKD